MAREELDCAGFCRSASVASRAEDESGETVAAFEDAGVRAGDRVLFEGLTWRIRRGEHWAVLGPNGSGKSALASALAGETPVVRGDLQYNLDGRGWTWLPPDGTVAVVSMDLHRALVREAISFHQARWSPVENGPGTTLGDVIATSGASPRSKRFRDSVALLGIGHLLGREIAQLSNGEMRKGLLARALAMRPRLLILDNPFAGLDRDSRARLRRIVRSLLKPDLNLVLVTQRAGEIPPGIRRVLLVEDGKAVARGPRRRVVTREVEARLDGAPPAVRAGRFGASSARRALDGAPLVQLRGVNVTYGKTPILRDVSWRIHAGEHWALVGPNGSGKTTLLSLVLGDNPQCYANDIRLFGRPRGSGESIWEIRRRIGWLAPELQFCYDGDIPCWHVVCSGLFGSIGLYETVTAEAARRVRRWMRNLNVLHLADAPFGSTSDGEQRMVLLARAVVMEPPLLFLDEPCQGLDAAHREVVVRTIQAIGTGTPTGIVYVTHNRDEMPECVNRVLHLRDGHARAGRRGGGTGT